jgi:hypothetical protein
MTYKWDRGRPEIDYRYNISYNISIKLHNIFNNLPRMQDLRKIKTHSLHTSLPILAKYSYKDIGSLKIMDQFCYFL